MGDRVGRAERRELLLDAAAALVRAGDAESVSMEAVAEQAGVSRPLVYKHFANRDELLGELYRRAAAQLHDQLTADVLAAGSLEDGFRALVHGALAAAGAQGRLFAALRSAGAWSRRSAASSGRGTGPRPGPSPAGRCATWARTRTRRRRWSACSCRSSTRCSPSGARIRRASTLGASRSPS